jgi:hypothetical protein
MNCGRTAQEARIATGFSRHYPDESNARNLQQRRQEILDDITDTTGAVFMGLTYGCARCHNHKFDPILQADYYKLQSFFANTAAADHIPMLTAEQLAEFQRRKAEWEQASSGVRAQIAALLQPERDKLRKAHVHDIHATILWCLGLDHVKVTYLHNGRSERPTIVSGEPIREMLV